jgi:plastocyanin
MRTSVTVLAAAALLTAGLAGCSSSSADSSSGTQTAGGAKGTRIALSQLMFMPAATTIKVGTTLTWTNNESISHTVTSGQATGVDKSTTLRSGEKPDGLFDKQLPKKGDSFSYTFTKVGTFSYYCDIHKGMNATVVVTN